MKEKKVVLNGEGKSYNFMNDHVFVKVPSQTTDNKLSIVEDNLDRDFYLGRHHHKIMTEIFYIIEGVVEIVFDDETIMAKAGDTITVPPNVWHTAICKEGGKMISIFLNGQFDLFLERLSTLSKSDFENAELMKSINEEFDIYNAEPHQS